MRGMTQKSEQQFLAFLKGAEALETDEDKRTNVGTTNVYPESAGVPEQRTEAVVFSDAAQESSKDVRQGVTDRVLSGKPSASAAERALIGNVLKTRDFETSSLELKPVTKVSHLRSPTLFEQVNGIFQR